MNIQLTGLSRKSGEAQITRSIAMIKHLAEEALTALETYNRYDIRTDRYAHSTELIYELRAALDHKRQPLREPRVTTLFKDDNHD